MFNEDNTIEQMMLTKLQQNWWHYIPTEELPRAQNEVLVESMVKAALIRLNPEIAEECTSYNTEEKACCYVEIERADKQITKKCVEVDRNARFALNHLTIFTLTANDGEVFEDVMGTFQCGQEDKLCGMDVPEEIFQCSEHSSTSKSCCYLTTPTYTECILSDKKYNEETTYKLFDESTVYCYGKIINHNVFILMAFFIIYLLLL